MDDVRTKPLLYLINGLLLDPFIGGPSLIKLDPEAHELDTNVKGSEFLPKLKDGVRHVHTRRVLNEELRPLPKHNVPEDHVHAEESRHDEERVDVARTRLVFGVHQKVVLES